MVSKDDLEKFQAASSDQADLEYNLRAAEQKLGLPDWSDQMPLSAARLLRIGVPSKLVEIIEGHTQAIMAAVVRGDRPPEADAVQADAIEELERIVAAKAFGE